MVLKELECGRIKDLCLAVVWLCKIPFLQTCRRQLLSIIVVLGASRKFSVTCVVCGLSLGCFFGTL